MSWEAANAPKARREKRMAHAQEGGDNDYDGTALTPQIKRRATETVEAALSRLSKAYTTSMECIGALQQTNKMLIKKDKTKTTIDTMTDEKALASLGRVSKAARTTLETAILLDPLILPHVPTLHPTMDEFCKSEGEPTETDREERRWQTVREHRPVPPVLSSAAHKSTIRELAYLALVNYSDLLLSCCACNCGSTSLSILQNSTILDRGVVKTLQALKEKQHCAWDGESDEETLRLALTALCDASKLDGSDPTLWLKLACAARGLERVVAAQHDKSTLTKTKYRRLQRYALEQGSQALPPTMPPNRAVVKALQELETELEPETYEPVLLLAEQATSKPIPLTLELPRYSWSMLGRMLIRACREGSDFSAKPTNNHHGLILHKRSTPFGSPVIVMHLSPMLVLPSKVLGRICLFLENGSIWRFEATCRALSVAIMSARASMEEEDNNINPSQLKPTAPPLPTVPPAKSGEVDKDDDPGQLPDAAKKDRAEVSEESKDSEAAKSKNDKEDKVPADHLRTSKRLRSQQITSGKIAERSAKRKSFEYCFLAATLSTTREKHRETVRKFEEDKSLRHLFFGHDISSATSKTKGYRSDLLNNAPDINRQEASERLGDSSLSAFVEKRSSHNSGPMDLLLSYLVHVAINVEDVFASDPSGTVILTSCILACFELCLRRSGHHQGLAPRLYKPVKASRSLVRSLELFAVDLLHAELILRQCDRYSPTHVEFDDDSNLISLMVPELLESCEELESEIAGQSGKSLDSKLCTTFALLKIRCNWLAAGFYLWRSRIAYAVSEAREAEEEGTSFIKQTSSCFASPLLTFYQRLPTPHLVSPGRSESHWKEISPESLAQFRDEIQASSVVSLVRQKFEELVAEIDQKQTEPASGSVTEGDAKSFVSIGETLFERYKSAYGDSEAKHTELVEDFLSVHGDALLAHSGDPNMESKSENGHSVKLAAILPARVVEVQELLQMSNPSILSMLMICLQMNPSHCCRVAELLVRLVLTTRDLHISLLQRIADTKAMKRRGLEQDQDNFSDSDEDSVRSDDSSVDRNTANKNVDEKRARQCGHLVTFFIDHLCNHFSTQMNDDEKARLIASEECGLMIESTMKLASDWYPKTSKHTIFDDTVDQSIFRAIRSLCRLLYGPGSATRRQYFERLFFHGLVRTIIAHRRILDSLVHSQIDRAARSARQRVCLKRAEFIGLVATEVGWMMSKHLGQVQELVLIESQLLSCDGSSSSVAGKTHLSSVELQLFFDALLWLWKYASQSDTETTTDGITFDVCSSFDRPIVRKLRVPTAVAVVGLCGSATSSRVAIDTTINAKTGDPLCLSEFFDSEASANDLISDDEGDAETDRRKRKELLRAICHAVHCINLVVGRVDDKGALSLLSDKGDGPILPFVTTRVLNFLADSILLNFSDGDESENQRKPSVWSEEYPFSTRSTGELLDSILHKTFRWLYGFTLVGEKNHQIAGKDLGSSCATTTTDLAVEKFQLENTSAAAQLYRCIVRAYSAGRRAPPKAALELVSSALPPLKESARSKALRDFLFSADGPYFDLEDLARLVKKEENWDGPFKEIHNQLVYDDIAGKDSDSMLPVEEEVMKVRRGILSELASGPLPVVSTDSKSKSDSSIDDDRASSNKNEKEMSKKFFAILDDLCLGGTNDSEGWFRAAQCLTMKAELVADRLGLSKGFAHNTDFAVPDSRRSSKKSVSLSELEAEQEREAVLKNNSWVHFLGRDLSLYARHTWSSFSSLRACSAKIGNGGYHEMDIASMEDKPEAARVTAWRKIDALHQSENYLGWQEAWGGIFVHALRKLSVRFMCAALYALQSKKVDTSEEKVLMSELCESLGIATYSELMGSQNYGYPMHEMATKRKRELAIASNVCFQTAANLVEEPAGEDDDSEDRATWDLLFMIGKCNEKIAGTYRHEAFDGSSGEARMYEKYTMLAMQNYSNAYAQAGRIESDGGFIVDQSGGSAHGSAEVLYRMLASRLKCLVAAVSNGEDHLDQSEAEALRLTERDWFKKPHIEKGALKDMHTRDRVWNVLADVVTGLAQCRLDHVFFHRSVYRYAQALMWSPVLYDPSASEGSLGTVPATRSFQIRGLNNSTHAAHSAEVIMSSLFDKKRSQLCAVWVTTTASSSPFQILNNSTRKYDSLRGKYIAAYVETLRLCHRQSELETFLKWTSTSRRDLPSYFQASAMYGGNAPAKSHNHDCLLATDNSLKSSGFLVSAKRQTNDAFAYVLIEEMSKTSNGSEKKKVAENSLKHAYACYLRLHCSKEDLRKNRAWKYGRESIREVEAVCQAYLALDDVKKIGSDFGDWSGGARKSAIFNCALEKCRSVFPSLSGTFFSKKASAKGKKGAEASASDANEPQGAKRKESTKETTKVSFEVAVPEELKTGDTFLTQVKVGDNTKKVKLTVPAGNPSTLRFTLDVPKKATEAEKAKKARVEEGKMS